MDTSAGYCSSEFAVWRRALFATVVILLFLGSPLWDAATLLMNAGGSGAPVSLFARGGATVLCVLYLATDPHSLRGPPVLLFVFLWACSSAAFLYMAGTLQWVSPTQMADFYVFVVKASSIFLFFEFLRIAVRSDREFRFVAGAVDIALSCYVVAILVSPFLGFDVLHSYTTSDRFGFRGIVAAPNEAAGVLIAATAWYCLRSRHFDGVRNWYRFLIPMSLVASLFLGTKASFLGAALIYAVYSIDRSGGRRSFLFFFLIGAMSAGALRLLYLNVPYVTVAMDATIAYYEWQWVNTAQGNLLSIILSGRDVKVEQGLTAVATLFAGAPFIGGYPVSVFSFEMDLLDLLFTFGFMGSVFYLLNLLAVPFSSLGAHRFLNIGIVLVVLLVATIAGHILSSGVASVYLAATLFHMSWKSRVTDRSSATERPARLKVIE